MWNLATLTVLRDATLLVLKFPFGGVGGEDARIKRIYLMVKTVFSEFNYDFYVFTFTSSRSVSMWEEKGGQMRKWRSIFYSGSSLAIF